MPTLDTRFIDLQKRQKARLMLKGKIASYGLEITELSTHLQGQLVAVHPAYDDLMLLLPQCMGNQKQGKNGLYNN
jgi:hypothetical protein